MYAIFLQNNLEFYLGVVIPVDRIILHWYSRGADGRWDGVREPA